MTGSGTGKKAFLENNSLLFSTTGTVHFAGSDSVLSSTELSTYTTNFNQPTNANRYGALIQCRRWPRRSPFRSTRPVRRWT